LHENLGASYEGKKQAFFSVEGLLHHLGIFGPESIVQTLNESDSTPFGVSRDPASRSPSTVYTNESKRTLEA